MNASTEKKQNKRPHKSSFTKGLLEQVELIVIFFAIIILIFSFVCKTCIVDGDSMLNTLHNGERVVVWNLFYTPDYGDIVVIHESGDLNKPIVKRIIGLPGDSVKVEHYSETMKVTITHADGSSEILTEDYIRYEGTSYAYYSQSEIYIVGDGEVFVMGDNRLDSLDSRKLGCVDSRQILGKVVLRITPFDKFGTVK